MRDGIIDNINDFIFLWEGASLENLEKLVLELCKYETETPWLEFKHNNYDPYMRRR